MTSTPPSALPPADLASVFSPPDRTAGLNGLKPRPLTAVPPAQADTAATPNLAPDEPAAATTDRPVRDLHPPAASAGTGGGLRAVTVYVTLTHKNAVQRQRAAAALTDAPLTNADIVLGAVEAAHPHLPDLLAPTPPGRSGPLFHRTARNPQPTKVQLGLRLRQDDLAVLDTIAAALSAGDRSRLVEAALQHHYGTPQ